MAEVHLPHLDDDDEGDTPGVAVDPASAAAGASTGATDGGPTAGNAGYLPS